MIPLSSLHRSWNSNGESKENRVKMEGEEEREIIIVGAGICGLSTALALHRKGIRCLILEKSESLRAAGGGITMRSNGWRALEQLCVASKLREISLPLRGFINKWLDSGKQEETTFGVWETRCLRRCDLINTLAESLPAGTILFGCKVLSVELDPLTSFPILQLSNGSVLKAKILIGCDGISSVVAAFLGLQPPTFSSLWETRGLTKYPNGHNFGSDFAQVNGDHVAVGRIPIDDNLVYWFVTHKRDYQGSSIPKDTKSIKKSTLELIKGFPYDMIEMVSNSDPDSVHSANLRYRPPRDVLLKTFRRGTVTVAGDAMHAMYPFLGQGGTAGIEDGIVLARCFVEAFRQTDGGQEEVNEIEMALDEYVKQRRMRLVWLTLQTYLIGLLFETSSFMWKFACRILLSMLFGDPNGHYKYDYDGL